MDESRIKSSLFSEIPGETEYDQIEVYANKSRFSGGEEITYTVINHNAGHGFWLLRVPFVEKKDGDHWIMAEYKENFLDPMVDYWVYCCQVDHPEQEMKAPMGLFQERAFEKGYLEAGVYRLKVYAGRNLYYSEFMIEEP